MENEVKTVTIPIDEYFELRSKAEANLFLMTELGNLQGRINVVENRLWDFERKLGE